MAKQTSETLMREVMREMGSRGGRKGGPARMASMTPEERRELARYAARQRWKKVKKDDVPAVL